MFGTGLHRAQSAAATRPKTAARCRRTSIATAVDDDVDKAAGTTVAGEGSSVAKEMGDEADLNRWAVQHSSPISRIIQRSQSMAISRPKTAAASVRGIPSARSFSVSNRPKMSQAQRRWSYSSLNPPHRPVSSQPKRSSCGNKDGSSNKSGISGPNTASRAISRSSSFAISVSKTSPSSSSSTTKQTAVSNSRPLTAVAYSSGGGGGGGRRRNLPRTRSAAPSYVSEQQNNKQPEPKTINTLAGLQNIGSTSNLMNNAAAGLRFRSNSLSMQVSLSEQVAALHCLSCDDPIARRLKVAGHVFDRIIACDAVLGPVLQRLKTEYEQALHTSVENQNNKIAANDMALDRIVHMNEQLKQSLDRCRIEKMKADSRIVDLLNDNRSLRIRLGQQEMAVHELKEEVAARITPRDDDDQVERRALAAAGVGAEAEELNQRRELMQTMTGKLMVGGGHEAPGGMIQYQRRPSEVLKSLSFRLEQLDEVSNEAAASNAQAKQALKHAEQTMHMVQEKYGTSFI